jgi:hypothetical protein
MRRKERSVKGLVISKNEITKFTKLPLEQVVSGSPKSSSIKEYHLHIAQMAKQIEEMALKLDSNLLSVKMALMMVVRRVEGMMKERREG